MDGSGLTVVRHGITEIFYYPSCNLALCKKIGLVEPVPVWYVTEL